MNFDGDGEIRNRLERGASFGLTKPQYSALANLSMGAKRMAGVEPCEIQPLRDRPGADVLLFGRHWLYTLRMEPTKERSTLYGQQLDSSLLGPGVELRAHEFNGSDFVGDILSVILHLEGIPLMDAQEAADYVREQQFRNPPRPRPIWE